MRAARVGVPAETLVGWIEATERKEAACLPKNSECRKGNAAGLDVSVLEWRGEEGKEEGQKKQRCRGGRACPATDVTVDIPKDQQPAGEIGRAHV